MSAAASRNSWRVRIVENGRDGEVVYEEGGRALSFYWAFGAGDVVTSVAVGDLGEWRANHPQAADRREEIIARIGAEVIRQRAPSCRAEIDAAGRHLNIIRDGAPLAPTPAPKQAAAADFVWRLNKAKSQMSMIVLVLALIAGAALVAERSVLTIRTTGTPIGASARAGDYIVTPISRLEPYVPSLDRNHARDRYSVGLLIHSARDGGQRRFVAVSEGLSGGDAAKVWIAGASGDLVFLDGPQSVVIDARAARLLDPAAARAAPTPPRARGVEALAALSSAERRLEGLLAAPGEAGAPAFPEADGVHNAAFLRAASHADALRLEGGDSLALFHSEPYRAGFVSLARISAAGDVVWRTQTALGRVEEALPDPFRPALIGVRPRIEGEVPEPLLVVIDAQTGQAATHALLVE
jgi:hypothetical protein